MSHNVTLHCGCTVYVACHPHTGMAHTRVLEYRDPGCPVRKHEVGLRLALWELLPEPLDRIDRPTDPCRAAARRARRTRSGARLSAEIMLSGCRQRHRFNPNVHGDGRDQTFYAREFRATHRPHAEVAQ